MFPFDPPSLPTRLLSLALFALSLLFFIAGLGVYRNSSLHTGSPNDDMGGDADWAELMMLAFVRPFPPYHFLLISLFHSNPFSPNPMFRGIRKIIANASPALHVVVHHPVVCGQAHAASRLVYWY